MNNYNFEDDLIESSHDDDMDEVGVGSYEPTMEALSFIDDCEDALLYMMGQGITVEELEAFTRVRDMLIISKYTKEVKPDVQKNWTETIKKSDTLSIPRSFLKNAHTVRTKVEDSFIAALKAVVFQIGGHQIAVSTTKDQRDRGEMPAEFGEEFVDYKQDLPSDLISSQQQLLKVSKNGYDEYNKCGGLRITELIADESQLIETIRKSARHLVESKKVLTSQVADPCNFVFNGIDNPKVQSYEHAAVSHAHELFGENTLFINRTDTFSVGELANDQLNSNYHVPYLKFARNGDLGDIYTNTKAWKGIGHHIGDDFPLSGDSAPAYSSAPADVGFLKPLIDKFCSSGKVVLRNGFELGDRVVNRLIPARFSRIATIDDLRNHKNSVLITQLNVIAGLSNKNKDLYSSWVFYLFEANSTLCYCVPMTLLSSFPIALSIYEDNDLGLMYGLIVIDDETVSRYMMACTELNAYVLPWVYKFYLKPSFFSSLFKSIEDTVEGVRKHWSGKPFKDVWKIFGYRFMKHSNYLFLVGAKKGNDARVISFSADLMHNKRRMLKRDVSAILKSLQKEEEDDLFEFDISSMGRERVGGKQRIRVVKSPDDSGGDNDAGGSDPPDDTKGGGAPDVTSGSPGGESPQQIIRQMKDNPDM